MGNSFTSQAQSTRPQRMLSTVKNNLRNYRFTLKDKITVFKLLKTLSALTSAEKSQSSHKACTSHIKVKKESLCEDLRQLVPDRLPGDPSPHSQRPKQNVKKASGRIRSLEFLMNSLDKLAFSVSCLTRQLCNCDDLMCWNCSVEKQNVPKCPVCAQ